MIFFNKQIKKKLDEVASADVFSTALSGLKPHW